MRHHERIGNRKGNTPGHWVRVIHNWFQDVGGTARRIWYHVLVEIAKATTDGRLGLVQWLGLHDLYWEGNLGYGNLRTFVKFGTAALCKKIANSSIYSESGWLLCSCYSSITIRYHPRAKLVYGVSEIVCNPPFLRGQRLHQVEARLD